ncbi:MAG TPA: PAS domain S-box protein [Desulfobulbaceae bacterium]|nr:PAS domain S-box protein [Desulfobulbaceae bacterium]
MARQRPLHIKVNRIFILVALILFPIIVLLQGMIVYDRIRADYSAAMHTRIAVAQALIREELFRTDSLVAAIGNDLDPGHPGHVLSRLINSRFFELQGDSFYILDHVRTVLAISTPYAGYNGLEFCAMVPLQEGSKRLVRYYQSLLTKRSVIAIQYPLDKERLLVVERPLDKFIPIMASFEKGKRYAGELFFVLSTAGRTIYHPDRTLVDTRYNLGFDLKDRTTPDKDGFFSFVYHDRRFIALNEQFSEPSGWIMYYSVPASEMTGAIFRLLGCQLLFLTAFFLLLFFTLHFVFTKFFTLPVGHLVKSLEKSDRNKGLSLSMEALGNIQEFNTIAQAIKRRDEEVISTAERFQTVLNSLDAVVYVADLETYEVLFINTYGRNLYGDCVGHICYSALQGGREGPCEFCANKLLVDAQGNPSGIHVWEFFNKRTKRWFDCRDQAIKWMDGRLVRMEIATDITERKLAEEALLSEKERLDVTLRSIGDGVITTDVEGRVIYVNKVAEDLSGWTNDEARGRPSSEVFHIINEKTGKKCISPVQRVIELGRIVGLANHTALIARDGTVHSIADSGAPIRDRKSNIIGVVLVFRDISKEKKMEEELLKIRKLESVGVLAGGIAHDFNNILAAILGNVELLGYHQDDGDPEAIALLSDIKKATRRAAKLTRQLLTFSKGGDPVKAATSLPELITESAEFVLHGSRVSCRYDFPDHLWKVDADTGQLSQVIQNIVLNAKHAMPEGGTITIACANVQDAATESLLSVDKGEYVRISIVDTGIGVPMEIIDKIFDPYFTTKQTGSGLGLAICHSIINKHDGYLTVESLPGKGTTFTIYLPAAFSDERTSGREQIVSRAVKAARIMVMDDEEMLRNLAKSQLTILGHEPIPVTDGMQVINKYQELQDSGTPVDLVIMDLTIPGGMGGEETARKLLALDPSAKIIVASGYSNDPVMANYRDYGFKAAIAKPFNLSELSAAIAVALQVA